MFRAKPFAAFRELWKGEVGAFTVSIAKETDKKHTQKFHISIGVHLGNDATSGPHCEKTYTKCKYIRVSNAGSFNSVEYKKTYR
jgi:hypothetical protein